MLDESKKFRGEGEKMHPEPLPDELAKKFVDGTFLDGASIIHEGHKRTNYLLFARNESVPGIGDARLLVGYSKPKTPTPETTDQMRFEYVKADILNPDEAELEAQMHLGIIDSQTFNLQHRYVNPALRTGAGIGSRLLQTAEDWVRQVAEESHLPLTIRMQTGQESVIKWIQKMGYTIREDQRDILEEMDEHPERFFKDQVNLSERSARLNIKKDPYTFRIGTDGRYAEDAIRVTFEKVILDKKTV